MAMSQLIDPPQGWMYGFPKVFDFTPSHPNLPGEEYEQEFREWLVDNGYPRNLCTESNLRHCRFIG